MKVIYIIVIKLFFLLKNQDPANYNFKGIAAISC